MQRRVGQLALVGVMVVGSLLMWTAVPAAWLWIAGRFSRVSQSDMTSLAIVIAGIPTTMFFVGFGLGRVDRQYSKRFGATAETRVVGARWLHSLRGGDETEPVTMLDRIMVVNVGLALLTTAVWFALFSHGSQALGH